MPIFMCPFLSPFRTAALWCPLEPPEAIFVVVQAFLNPDRRRRQVARGVPQAHDDPDQGTNQGDHDDRNHQLDNMCPLIKGQDGYPYLPWSNSTASSTSTAPAAPADFPTADRLINRR